MADGEEARELSVKIPALRVEIPTRDLQCQAGVRVAQPRCSVAMAYALEQHCSIVQLLVEQLFSRSIAGRTTDTKLKNSVF
jgi:hypothetical protein